MSEELLPHSAPRAYRRVAKIELPVRRSSAEPRSPGECLLIPDSLDLLALNKSQQVPREASSKRRQLTGPWLEDKPRFW